MADRHLPALLAAAPHGPVRLAGYCHGGLAAMELARRLEADGRTVERVVLIDTFSINARPAMRALQPLAALAGTLAPGNLGRKIRRSLMPSLWVLARHVLARDPTILRRTARTLRSGTMRAWDASQRTTYYRAMAKYRPPRLRTDVACLLCEEYAQRPEYAAAPWRGLAGTVQSSNIPGEHNTCVSRHLNELAHSLNRVFAGA
jgi:thioesterase domain-containing protein